MMASFTAKITARFAVLVTATTALVLVAGGWLFWRLTIRGLDYLNHAEFVEIRDRIGEDPAGVGVAELQRRMLEHAEIDASLYFFQVYDSNGNVLFHSPNMGHSYLPALPRKAIDSTEKLQGVGDVRVGTYQLGQYRVQIASPLEPAGRISTEFLRVSLLLLAAVGIASVGLGWGFARSTLQPVRRIRETATRIRADNLSERIPVPPGRDELTALASLLNRMFDRLEASFNQIQQFTADTSHELKTPLALIRLHAERLHARLGDDSESAALSSGLLESIDELSRILDLLLFLAKAEGGVLTVSTAQIEAAPFVRAFADDAAVLAEDAGRRFQLLRADSGSVNCEPTLIRQLLLNIVTNALRVSPPSEVVTLESRLDEANWEIVITDRGPGLPADQLERIFQRFVRFTPTASSTGHGLGLAICRGIATVHRGTVRAEMNPHSSGLRVVIRLPRFTSDDVDQPFIVEDSAPTAAK